jgi:hypothetical protein
MERRPDLPLIPAILLLVIRGIALWFLVPLAFLFWVLAFPWIFRYSKSLRQFVTWVDVNFCVSLLRGPLRVLVPEPRMSWLPLSRITELTARTADKDFFDFTGFFP